MTISSLLFLRMGYWRWMPVGLVLLGVVVLQFLLSDERQS